LLSDRYSVPSAEFSQKKQNCIVTVKLDSCVLFDQFFLYEVNHIFLASVFGSLHTTWYLRASCRFYYDLPVFALTNFRTLSFRSPVKFSCSIFESCYQNTFRSPAQTSFRTPGFFVVFHLRTSFRTSCLFSDVWRS
jgi:hypothetical protein